MSKKEISNEPIYYGSSDFQVVTPANKFYKISFIFLSSVLCLLIVVTILHLFLKPLTPEQIIRKNASAVVAIETHTYTGDGILVGTGSGFIVDGSGYIVTNEHVVDGDCSVTVYTKDGKEYSARIVGADAYYDVAVLKIFSENEKYGFPTVKLGEAANLAVGEQIVAIGTPQERAYGWTSTVGIVSSSIRNFNEYGSVKRYVQFDAAVNGGNSGGPIFDSRGRVVGIVEKKVVDNEGMGLAIPIETVKELIFSFIDEDRSKPQFGVVGVSVKKDVEYFTEDDKIYVIRLDEESGVKYFVKDFNVIEFTDDIAKDGEIFVAEATGFKVSSVFKSSGAYGILEVGDIVTGFDGLEMLYDDVNSPYEMIIERLASKKAGDIVEIVFVRNGETFTESIKLTPKN